MPPHRLLMKMAFDTRMPLSRIRHFERKREIFFVRGKAKAVRIAASGKHPAPCPPKTVFHADRSTQKKEHGKRKRSLGCARDDDTRMPLPSCDFQPSAMPISAPSDRLLPKEGGGIPLRTHSSFQAKARNLFRSREDKGCERNGKREPPCSLRPEKTVFHADRSTQEKEHGKRKRSLGCARDDDTRILSSKKRRRSRHLNPES